MLKSESTDSGRRPGRFLCLFACLSPLPSFRKRLFLLVPASPPHLLCLRSLPSNTTQTHGHTLSLLPPHPSPHLSLSPPLSVSLLPRVCHASYTLFCVDSLCLSAFLPPSLPLSISPLSLWSSNSATARKNPTGCCFQRAHIGKAV